MEEGVQLLQLLRLGQGRRIKHNAGALRVCLCLQQLVRTLEESGQLLDQATVTANDDGAVQERLALLVAAQRVPLWDAELRSGGGVDELFEEAFRCHYFLLI